MSRPRRERIRSLAAVMLAGLAASGLVLVHGCTIMNGLVAPQREVAVDPDGAPGPGPPGADDGCENALVPSEPVLIPDPPESHDLLFALRDTVTFNAASGFDLDGVCTCSDGGASGVPGPDTCRVASATPQCDQANGRDNVVAGLLKTLKALGSFDLEARINQLISRGKSGLLVRLQGYSGGANDPNVQVSFYGSRGICTDAGVTPDGAPAVPDCTKPTFTDEDRWNFDPTQLLGSDGGDVQTARSKLFASRAYVKDHVLVAQIDGDLPLADLALTLTGGILVARIEKQPWRLDNGVLAGRWPVEKAFRAIRRLRSSDNEPALCQNALLAAAFNKQQVCALTDIMETPNSDGTGKTCNAVSMGMTFAAERASFGEPFTVEITDECPPSTFGECQ